MNTQQPRTILVHSESDLGNLVRGDIIKVVIGGKPEWAIYGGMGHRDAFIRDLFIEKPDEAGRIYVWGCERKYLQFPGDHVWLDKLHRDVCAVLSTNPSYKEIKALTDTLS